MNVVLYLSFHNHKIWKHYLIDYKNWTEVQDGDISDAKSEKRDTAASNDIRCVTVCVPESVQSDMRVSPGKEWTQSRGSMLK